MKQPNPKSISAALNLRPWPRPYSTSIADAWEVVEKMREHLDITISANQNTCEVRSRDFPDQIIACEQGDTIPHAICLASLKAVGNGKTNT